MKPLKLVFTAFGPYAKKSEIDFSDLDGRGLFLITGPTGAGKTTIFDALSYALYGKASGEFRSDSHLRSHYANPKDKTFVALDFEHNGKIYTVTRNPSFERPKLRGEGTTIEVASATLTEGNNVIATKIGDVTNEIENLLGINYDQFTQIAMIAQGDFRKVLTSNTEERSKILRKVFNTSIYKNLEQKIAEEKSKAKLRYENVIRDRVLALNRAEYSEDFLYKEEYEKLKEEKFVENVERGMSLLEKLISLDKEEKNKLQNKRADLRKEIGIISGKIVKATTDKDNRNKIKKLDEKIKDLNPKFLSASKRKEEARINYKRVPEIISLIGDIEKNIGLLKERKKAEKKVKTLLFQIEQNNKKLKSLKEEALNRREKVLEKEGKLDLLKDAEANIEKINNEVERNNSNKTRLEELIFAQNKNNKNLEGSIIEISKKEEDKSKKDELIKENRLKINSFNAEIEKIKDSPEILDNAKERFVRASEKCSRYNEKEEEKALLIKKKGKEEDREIKFREEIKMLNVSLEDLVKEKERLADIERKKSINELELEKLSGIKKEVNRLIGKENDIKKEEDSIKILERQLITTNNDHEKALCYYNEKKKLYLCDVAGVLASELKKGCCCPVCGSTNHPNPAVTPNNAPTREELEIEEKKCKDINKVLVEVSEKIRQKKKLIKKQKEELKEESINLDKKLGLEEKLEEVNNDIKKNEEEIKNIEKDLTRLSLLQGREISLQKVLDQKMEVYQEIKEKINKYTGKIDAALEEQKKILTGVSDINEAESQRKELESEFYKADKNFKKLEELKKKINAVDEEIKKETEELGEINIKVSALNQNKKNLEEKIAENKELINKHILNLGRGEVSINEAIRLVEEEEKLLDKKKNNAKEKVLEKKQLSNMVKKLKEKEIEENEKISKLNNDNALQKGQLEIKEASIEEINSKALNKTMEELKLELETNINNKDKFIEEKEKTEKEFSFIEGDFRECKAQIETLSNSLSKDEVSPEKLQKEKEDLEVMEAELDSKLTTISTRLNNNSKSLENVVKGEESFKEAENMYMEVSSLCDTLNGNIKGKQKINIETYVQMIFFEQIITKANKHFSSMSSGQYVLVRRKEGVGNRGKTGLDLNVLDYYSGREREINSLSGGEMFEASLSLAMGLSDVIQESAGGISLDAMFIDEGFGTLDEDVLEKSMKVLGNLADGERLVGIISHVAELKDRIESQIVVSKVTEGENTTSEIHVKKN